MFFFKEILKICTFGFQSSSLKVSVQRLAEVWWP